MQVQEAAARKEISPVDRMIQVLLSAMLTLLDDGIFRLDKEQSAKVFEVLVYAMEKMFGVKDGTFFERMCEQWTF